MRRAFVPVAAILLLVVAVAATSVDPLAPRRLAALRVEGPAGLDRLLAEQAVVITKGPQSPGNADAWRRAADAIDTVAAQRDAWASKLYWYTDLDQAKAVAARDGKPILSLRLLGKLDTELSCANSRFFRTTLYPDPRVSSLLREKFVLHWSSERPVPVVTVDFGDGRTMKRTVTGNSIHYVLDADGRPLDALPGLYAAKAFVARLNDALALAAEKPTDARLRAWHADAAKRLEAGPPPSSGLPEPLAPEVVRLARTKAAAASGPRDNGMRYGVQAPAGPRAPVGPNARAAALITASKVRVEDPLVRMLTELEPSIAQDTIQNEYGLHARIHGWFAAGLPAVRQFETFNERVYSELFLTPRSDPWLGLAPPDAYPALDQGGLAQY